MPIPAVKKSPTATIDLLLNLGKPHKPCPLVHPFPNLVPNPTSNPDKMYPITDKFSYS